MVARFFIVCAAFARHTGVCPALFMGRKAVQSQARQSAVSAALAYYAVTALVWPHKMQNPEQVGASQKIKQLRWLDHAIFGILVNMRYQIENPNSTPPLSAAAHIAWKKNYLQYQSDGKFILTTSPRGNQPHHQPDRHANRTLAARLAANAQQYAENAQNYVGCLPACAPLCQ